MCVRDGNGGIEVVWSDITGALTLVIVLVTPKKCVYVCVCRCVGV